MEYVVGCAIDAGSAAGPLVISLLVRRTEGIAAIAFSACACLSAVITGTCAPAGPLDSGVGIEDIDEDTTAFEADVIDGSELPDDRIAGDIAAGEAIGKPVGEGEARPRVMLIVGVLLSDLERGLVAKEEALPRCLDRDTGEVTSTFVSATSTVM